MKIVDLLKVESIDLKAQPKDKAAALEHLITLMESGGNLLDKDEYRACVLRREEEGSTGIGEGIAIPHAKTSAVKAPGLAAMLVKDGVDFDSLDGEPAKLFFLIAAPDTKDNVHLDVLSHLSMLLMNDDFRSELLNAGSAKDFLAVSTNTKTKNLKTRKQKHWQQSLLSSARCWLLLPARQVLHIPIWQQRLCRRWPVRWALQ